MQCHQCDLTQPLHNICPECESEQEPLILGTGTEQVEDNLKIFFPDARILRMDRDTLNGKHALSKMHNLIRNHEVDIVIGTQLVTKGHDFPEVTLVGVIFSDLSLNIPDFRSSERTFQLLTQVAGRAGRGNKPGEVLIQTHNPRHHSLICAKDHDSLQFREAELKQRHSLRMPPNYSLTLILCSSPHEDRAEQLARELDEKIRIILSNTDLTNNKYLNNYEQLDYKPKIIGPFEAPIKKLRNRFRWQLMLKAGNVRPLLNLLNVLFENKPATKRDELIQIDVDPQNMM
jgi:primosomal protein N''